MSSTMYVAAVTRDRAAEMLKNPPKLGRRPNSTGIDNLRKHIRDGLMKEPSPQSEDWG